MAVAEILKGIIDGGRGQVGGESSDCLTGGSFGRFG